MTSNATLSICAGTVSQVTGRHRPAPWSRSAQDRPRQYRRTAGVQTSSRRSRQGAHVHPSGTGAMTVEGVDRVDEHSLGSRTRRGGEDLHVTGTAAHLDALADEGNPSTPAPRKPPFSPRRCGGLRRRRTALAARARVPAFVRPGTAQVRSGGRAAPGPEAVFMQHLGTLTLTDNRLYRTVITTTFHSETPDDIAAVLWPVHRQHALGVVAATTWADSLAATIPIGNHVRLSVVRIDTTGNPGTG
jgi:hypothetical protein